MKTILFAGDSITDCGCRRENAPLGNGYVKILSDMLTIRQASKQYHLINAGVGGNTIVELQERWTDDVIRRNPDQLVLMIGINDCCRTVVSHPGAVDSVRYASIYSLLLQRLHAQLPDCRLLLLEPFYISNDSAPDSIRTAVLQKLPAYLHVVHQMTRRYHADLLQTHRMFQTLLTHHEPQVFCPEPVHPHATGHFALAEAIYAKLWPNKAQRKDKR